MYIIHTQCIHVYCVSNYNNFKGFKIISEFHSVSNKCSCSNKECMVCVVVATHIHTQIKSTCTCRVKTLSIQPVLSNIILVHEW